MPLCQDDISWGLRFCEAMIEIRKEAEEVITGQQPKDNNVLKNAPHPIDVLAVSEQEWNKCVSLVIQLFLVLNAPQTVFS
jgi:glycine cleavage system protein P-like pyridoxal-binding family